MKNRPETAKKGSNVCHFKCVRKMWASKLTGCDPLELNEWLSPLIYCQFLLQEESGLGQRPFVTTAGAFVTRKERLFTSLRYSLLKLGIQSKLTTAVTLFKPILFNRPLCLHSILLFFLLCKILLQNKTLGLPYYWLNKNLAFGPVTKRKV